MAVLAKTIREARDHVLKRIGSYGSTTYEDLMLECINDAVNFVAGQHDWKYLTKKTTFTTSDATGTVLLPDDLDRVLAIFSTGADRFLTELSALDFNIETEAETVTEPSYFTVSGFDQDTETEAPRQQIDIYTAPAASTTYNLWYIKQVDEYTSSDLDKVPVIPPRIWSVVMRKATMEILKIKEAKQAAIDTEYNSFMMALSAAKKAEDFGSSRRGSIGMRQGMYSRYHNRAGR
jgi:hypothetical protein